MKSKRLLRVSLAVVSLAFIMVLLAAPNVSADGGPIIPDASLWASLSENQQIAVVRINRNNTVNIDLFISLLDTSGQSHEITYFLPLGESPTNPQSAEMTSLEFDRSLTANLDRSLADEARRKQYTQAALLPAPVLLHGIWLLPFLTPLALSGCSAGTAPEATLNTPSSQINIFGLDTTTDITELIEVAGLNPSVQDTLERLRGQKIAIVKLRTQPFATSQGKSPGNQGQPGLRFSWIAPAISTSNSNSPAFIYPLGTGSAWAKPIEVTRVYIIAPRDISFNVQYPRLGENISGTFVSELVYNVKQAATYGKPAFAIEDTLDSQNRIWRATYRLSNSAEDILVTVNESNGLSGWIHRTFPLRIPVGLTLLMSIIAALMLWVLAWRYILPRRIPLISYSWKEARLWSDALIYPGINLGMFLFFIPAVAVALVLLGSLLDRAIPVKLTAVTIGILIVIALLILLGLPVWLFIRKFRRISEHSKPSLFLTYVLVVLAANLGYIIMAAIYAVITRAF